MGMTPGEIMWERSVGAEERTREIVNRLRNISGLWPTDDKAILTSIEERAASAKAIADWLKREYLTPAGGEEGDPACPMCDKPIGVLPDDGGCDCLVDYQEGEL